MQIHQHLLFTILALAAPAAAQAFYIPDPAPAGVACNVIPFGTTGVSTTWGNQIYQTLVTAADLNSTPGLITGLGFSPCGSGDYDFDAIEV